MFTFFLVVWAVVAGSQQPVRVDLQELPTAEACVAGVTDALGKIPEFMVAHPDFSQMQAVCEVWPVPGTDL
jgi:hypothetical protein